MRAFILPLAVAHDFTTFTAKFGKTYAEDEVEFRRATFQANVAKIEEHNAKPGQMWSMGVNQFTDMTDEEFSAKVLMAPQHCSATGRVGKPKEHDELPESVDWRLKNVISEVKNQQNCGSCWAFSTVGAVEAHTAITYGQWRSPRVAEQQLVDCAGNFDTHGCNGGLPSHAFEYIKSVGGIASEFSYPYHAKDGKCAFASRPGEESFDPRSMGGPGAVVPGGSVNITSGDEDSLKYFLATKGPVSVAYQVSDDFRHYAGGVYTSTQCKSGDMDVNHAVLAVGYGVDPETKTKYWLIKNSWDYTFGEDGYFKIEAFKNMCGIADCNSYPDVKSPKREDTIFA